MKQIILLLLVLTFTVGHLSAQDTPEQLEVQRCADIDRSVPIDNIFIDGNNNKWVADAQGLFLAQSPDYAKETSIKADQWTLLSAPDGNQELYLPKAQLEELLGFSVKEISTASIDAKKKELWIGTADRGLFLLSTQNGLTLLEKLNSKNSKLRSNNIKSIFIKPDGEVLAATDDGLFSSKGNKTSLYSKGYDFTSMAYNKGTVWVVADGEVLEMDKKGNLYEGSFDERMFDGPVVDIDFDGAGNMWIASEVVARYHFDTETYDFFGPAEDFTSQSVKCIAADSDGALWVGTQNKGVFYIGKSSSLNGSLFVTEYLECKSGAKNAAIEVRATGGEPPYVYEWNQGLKGENPKGLGPGTYAVTITDQKGKKANAEVTITESTFTMSTRLIKEASLGGGKDGSAVVEIKGGNGQYTYAWDNGETVATAVQLPAGDHVVTISEKGGCTTTATVTIIEKLGVLSVNLEQINTINCAGEKSASLAAKVSGGQEPYTYQWMGAAGFTESATNLGAGKYTVVVTDANNNTTVSEMTIEEPAILEAIIKLKSPATANNADGKATAKAKGGTGKNYTYQWDTGETTDTASKLALGKRTVTVTDEKGCTTTANIDITEDILPLSVQLNNSSSIKCAGETTAAISAEVSGGKSPFTYAWKGTTANAEKATDLAAGDYEVTVTDAAANTAVATINIKAPEALSAKITPKSPATVNNADGKATVKVSGGTGKKFSYKWDNGETDDTANKLTAGTRTVTVTDENGCTATSNITVTEDILPLNVNLDLVKSINCAGEKTATLKAEVNGGKSPFTYNWSESNLKGENATALAAGKYELTITDAAGTTAVTNIDVKAPAPIELSINIDQSATTNNSDGKATAQVKGGTGKYVYNWDNKEATSTATKLSPGKHQLTVTDEKGCTATANIEITENILPLAVSIKQTGIIKCNGEKTGALEVNTQGGKTPFTYTWNNPAVKGASASQLSGGIYELTLTDASGLSQTESIEIVDPELLAVVINKKVPATNENSRDGKASLTVSGGTEPFSYQWDTKEITAEAVKLPIGDHSVTVTDANGCSDNVSLKTLKKNLPALTAGRLKQGQTLQVSNLYFEADSTNMTAESYPTLVEIADFLKDNPLVVIEVGGHTNNIPKEEYCDYLSTERAKAVAGFIVNNGIDKNRVLYKGYGKREPKYSNNHKDGRAKNQRVEMKILSLQ